MSKKAHEISTSALVFNNITAVGIANGVWMMDPANKKESDRMLSEIQALFYTFIIISKVDNNICSGLFDS